MTLKSGGGHVMRIRRNIQWEDVFLLGRPEICWGLRPGGNAENNRCNASLTSRLQSRVVMPGWILLGTV
jgi:hypothetical protein